MSEDARNGGDDKRASARPARERLGGLIGWGSRAFANRRSVWPMATIILVGGALLLFLMWGWPRFFSNAGDVAARSRPPIAGPTSEIRIGSAGADTRGAGAPVATAPPPPVLPGGPGPAFAEFYQQHGGLALFGLPISEQIVVNGRTVQWFERTRLELWPEFAGTPYAVQIGRLGAEFAGGARFHQQSPFPSRPDLRFFPETGHAVGEPFLSFWAQNGGLDQFGLPISEAVPENLPDGQVHTVQYFERARLEQHGGQVLVGLLGSALFRRDGDATPVATPALVTVPPPTPVPIQ
jgi:hypothetical protein